MIECFAKKADISLDEALGFFYMSDVYTLVDNGVSDMHCMSDGYLAEELETEYNEKIRLVSRKTVDEVLHEQ